MIVDIHTHFMNIDTDWGPQVFQDLDRCRMNPDAWRFTAEDHLRETLAADVAIVFGLAGARTGWNIPNDAVAAHVRRAADRLLFFTSIDPGEPGFMEELERTHEELGAVGVKLGPVYQGVHPLDKSYYEIYRYCARHGLPILTHMAATFSSGVPLEYARPIHMDQVATDFPDLKIVLAHMGHPWEGETIAVIRKQPNVYADISALYYRPWQFYNSMRLLTEYRAQDNVLFGSDYPATTTSGSIAGLRNVNAVLGNSGLPPVPETAMEEIIHRDALTLLGLPMPGGSVS
jgi:predicted TIM-barrel fold metal-dependent hydrolase